MHRAVLEVITPVRTALVHDWLTGMRGGERCLEVFAELLPEAPILTLFHEKGSVSKTIESHPVVSSPLSKWSFLRRRYRKLLPLFPWAARRLPGQQFDLLVSLSHCAAKAVPRRHGARHICYCFTPARYLWDHAETYLNPERSSWPVRLAAKHLLPGLRDWDQQSAKNVDRFIAISHYVAERIQRIYGRDSDIIYPPVDLSRFAFAPPEKIQDHTLIVSALAPYKGVDLAIAAFNKLDKKLVIIGKGEDENRLRSLANDNIEFRGWQSDEAVAKAYRHCRSFLLPCEEDFGITPLEAMASGRPVIALGKGGALETVVAGKSGSFFEQATVDSLIHSIENMDREHQDYDPTTCRAQAELFDLQHFRNNIQQLLAEEKLLLASKQALDHVPGQQ